MASPIAKRVSVLLREVHWPTQSGQTSRCPISNQLGLKSLKSCFRQIILIVELIKATLSGDFELVEETIPFNRGIGSSCCKNETTLEILRA